MFKPLRKALPLLLGIAFAALSVRLGFWQLHRAEFKQARQAQYDAALLSTPLNNSATLATGQRRSITGKWLAQHGVLLDNRVYQGQAGYQLLMPFQLAQGPIVAVNRGWLPARVARTELAALLASIPTPSTTLSITVRVSDAESPPFNLLNRPTDDAATPLWQRAEVHKFNTRLQQTLAPFVLLQENSAPDGLVRAWPRPDFGVDKHKGYAFQWFAFATLSLVLSLFFTLRPRWRAAQQQS